MTKEQQELVERIQGLYAKATPGPWNYFEESDGCKMWGQVWVHEDGEDYCIVQPQFITANAEIVAALVNSWPQIAALIAELAGDAGKWRYFRDHSTYRDVGATSDPTGGSGILCTPLKRRWYHDSPHLTCDTLDTAIDAALSAAQDGQ